MDANIKEKVQLIPTLEKFYVPFHAGTNQPFVTCHSEDFTDQIWIFVTEEQCHEYAMSRVNNYGDPIRKFVVKNEQALQFFASLFFIGIDEVVFVEETDMTRLALTDIVKKPNFEEVPENMRPLYNPQMQLTGLKLMQEIHRRAESKPTIRDLEDEMVANLMRSKFLLVTAMLEEGEDPNDPEKRGQVPCIQTKDGVKFQPIFTDSNELQKFVGNRRFKAMLMDFVEISKLINESVNGIVVNPHTLNLIFRGEKIPDLINAFMELHPDYHPANIEES